MLTDYHVHLRRDDPDDPETSAARAFTAANADRYRTVASERQNGCCHTSRAAENR